MNVAESKNFKKGSRVCWQGNAADSGRVTETRWDAVTLHPTQIAAWKREAVEKLAQVFDDKGTEREKNRDGEITKQGEIGGVIEPRIYLSQAAILFRKPGPPLTAPWSSLA